MQQQTNPPMPPGRYGASGSVLLLNPTDRAVRALTGLTPAQLRDDATMRGLGSGSGVTLTSVAPNTVAAGAGNTAITVTGGGIPSGSTLLWDAAGVLTAVTWVSATSMTATIPSTLLVTAGTHQIQVLTPGSTVSFAVTFTVT